SGRLLVPRCRVLLAPAGSHQLTERQPLGVRILRRRLGSPANRGVAQAIQHDSDTDEWSNDERREEPRPWILHAQPWGKRRTKLGMRGRCLIKREFRL